MNTIKTDTIRPIIGGLLEPKIIQKYTNRHDSIEKKPEIKQLIPDSVTECATFLNRQANEPCSDPNTIATIGRIIGRSGDSVTILNAAKDKTGCETERCVIETLAKDIGPQIVKGLISTHFKLNGPTDTALLNNYNIDETLRQFQTKWPDFFPYNFNMVNYREYSFRNGRTVAQPDTLETIQLGALIPKYKTAGCVINTDTYQGQGKHWMALFADWRNHDSASVEFFNSSGNAPDPAWILWMERSRDALVSAGFKMRQTQYGGFSSDLCRVTNKRHQQSTTECGVYSLFYIYARLNGISPDYFNENFIPDQWIFEFRQHLFDGSESRFFIEENSGKFDWDKYNKIVKVKWEKTP